MEFRKDPQLGVAGTIFREHGYSSSTDSFEGQAHVSGRMSALSPPLL